MPKRHGPTHCSGPHSIGGMMPGMNGEPYVAHVYRVFPGFKLLRAEIDGKVFQNSEEANQAIINKGYGCWLYNRESVVIPEFAKLKGQQNRAKFDALYRKYKWMRKQKSPKYIKKIKLLLPDLKLLAKEVGIFHPCAQHVLNETVFNRNKAK